MFKRKSVNWRKLSHAYGSARDVPQMFKALMAEDVTVRGQALDKMSASLCHQGTVYNATVAAVPLLIELLQMPEVQDKDEILVLLACIAHGSGEDLLFDAQEYDNPAFPALLDGLSPFLRLLQSPVAKIRAASSFLLTKFAEVEPAVSEELSRALLVENDPTAKGSLILNLPKEVSRQPSIHALLMKTVKEGQHPIVRLAAAKRLTIDFQQETPPEAVAVLIDALSYSKPLAEAYKELAAKLNDAAGDAADCLCLAGKKYLYQTLPVLLEALDKTNSAAALKVAHALLYLTFERQNTPPERKRTPEQEAVLQAVAGSRRAWRYNGNMAEILRFFSLPNHPVALRAYLDGHDPLQAMMGSQGAAEVG